MDGTRDLSSGSEIAGYRIEAVAGRGGMGIVYRATDVQLDRQVALKLISGDLARDGSFRERFKRESRLAASIRHPNVVTVFRAGEEDGLLYIAMDYVEGTDLAALVGEHGALDLPFAVDVIAQVASALDTAHAKALVHRDVKPANVLIADAHGSPHAYLTDFGLTKDVSSQSGMTQTGMVLGTLDYVAPEQIEGGPLDARADVYSLGCVLYQVLTGRVPYPRETSMAKMYAHLQGPTPSVHEAAPELPRELDAVVKRAMAKRPEDRFPSAGDLARAMRAAVEGRLASGPERTVAVGAAAPVTTTGDETRLSTDRRLRRTRARRLAAPVAGLLLVGAVAALVLILSGGGDSGAQPLTKDQYQDGVLDATRPFNMVVVETEPRIPPHVKEPEDAVGAARELARVRKSEDQAITAVARLTPPDEVKDLHFRLIDVLRRTRSDVADAVAAADFGNDQSFRTALGAFKRDSRLLDPIGEGFRAKGYGRLTG